MTNKTTKTQDFGSSKREGHDSSQFYSSKLYEGFEIDENQQIIDSSSTLSLSSELFTQIQPLTLISENKIPSCSLHLIFLSIPVLDQARYTQLDNWLDYLKDLIHSMKDKLITGGRLVVLVNNHVDSSISPTNYFPLHQYVTRILLDEKLILRGNIIHHIPNVHSGSNNLTNTYHLSIIACKNVLKRIKKGKKGAVKKTDTITRDQFLSYTKSVWNHEPDLISHSSIKKMSASFDYLHRFLHLFSFHEDFCLIVHPEMDEDFRVLLQAIRGNSIAIKW